MTCTMTRFTQCRQTTSQILWTTKGQAWQSLTSFQRALLLHLSCERENILSQARNQRLDDADLAVEEDFLVPHIRAANDFLGHCLDMLGSYGLALGDLIQHDQVLVPGRK
ncbi:hypothetical protein MN608_10283 [Microdochium nivale]|nr:hypothetical protein MN608_10283 [Microdochium nivale]